MLSSATSTTSFGTPLHERSRSQHSVPTELEEKFLHAVDFGDVSVVKSLLEEYPNLNVDCTDALGRTPLRLAVKNENKELVEILLCLSNPDNMNEAVLQAIDSGYTNIAAITLRHPRYLDVSKRMKRMGDTDGFFKPERDSQFPSYVTPLNLAAQKNQYVIVQLLLQRGETIIKPHKFSCGCQECINKSKYDMLRLAKCRLDAYRGLASEAYISLYSKDPFLTAFDLANELRHLANTESFFKMEYTDLANKLSDYVVKLLDRVWTQRELSAVLDKTGPPQEDKFENLSRFKLALEYQEKLFVSHPNCQQRVDRCWYEGLEIMDRASWPKRLLFVILAVVIYPVWVLVFLFLPKSKIGKYLALPAVKFISHTLSFFVFLILIIISTMETISLTSNTNTLKNYHFAFARYTIFRNATGKYVYGADFPLRPFEATATELMITVWIVAMIVQECQELWHSGFKAHFSDKFNLMDLLLLSVYTATYTLRYWTHYKWKQGMDALEHDKDFLIYPERTEKLIYWLNADRMFWRKTDPINMAEGLFAMANILSFSRMTYLLPANETLGPMQISLGRMINDIVKFFVLVIFVVAAFMVALRNLFWYYANRDSIELDHTKIPTPEAVEWYGSELDTFRTVFWSIYGRGVVKSVSLGQYNNFMTENIGQAIDGIYHITMIIVFLNILIAMMSRSFEMIAADADMEWKFARSALYMDYITEGRVLPVPLNVIEIPHDIFRYFFRLLKRKKDEEEEPPPFHGGRRAACSNIASQRHLKRQNRVPSDDEPTPSGTPHVKTQSPLISRCRAKSTKGMTVYQEIIQSIIQRYIYDIQREHEIMGGSTDDVKNLFERMRCEILAQYKVKDDNVSMAMGAVRGIAKEIAAATKTSPAETDMVYNEPLAWRSVGNSSQDTDAVKDYLHQEIDLTLNDYIENYQDILCDVYEDPNQLSASHIKDQVLESIDEGQGTLEEDTSLQPDQTEESKASPDGQSDSPHHHSPVEPVRKLKDTSIVIGEKTVVDGNENCEDDSEEETEEVESRIEGPAKEDKKSKNQDEQ